MWKSLSGVATLLLLGGCAVGVKHDFNQQALDLGSTTATVAVGTLDHRPYVVDGEKGPQFVGVSRGGFGNPFSVTTQSGRPLATEISSSIAGSMRARGVNAKEVGLRPSSSVEQAGNALRAAGMQRSVLLTLLEWRADSMVNVGLAYDLELRVFDQDGRQLTFKPLQGREKLGAADPFAPGGSSEVTARFRRMMEVLFQEPDVVKALQQ